ncbi:MAG: mercuric reductase [candidate division Zixibacteria bacterium]|nr:mercuric reductase [candidate division Zixibacteria bacterium]
MANSKEFDGIVIGSGQSGGPLSGAFARAGWKMALIEKAEVGGTCVNVGCTPTKTMVASARVAHVVSRAKEYGVNISGVSVNLNKVRERKRNIVNMFRSGGERGIANAKVKLFRGKASFVDSKMIEIELSDGSKQTLTAKKIFINTGTRNSSPNIAGLDQVKYLDSTSIMELNKVPNHLIVVGGGYIGLEFGQMFRRFGSKVTILHQGAQLLDREDSDIATEVAKILEGEGINIQLKASVKKVSRSSKDKIKVEANIDGKTMKFTGSHLLIATGRVPESDELNLQAAGIKTNRRGFIKVNSKLETTARNVYAIGDVNGGPAFTHISYDDFRIMRTNLLNNGSANTNGRLVPYTVFIDPQLGRVGISEKEAKNKGLNYRVGKIPMTHVARALEMDETRGFMKVIVDAKTEQILGCAILGVEGGEVMSVIQMAMMGKVRYTKIRDGIFAHPLLSESLNNLFMAMDR